MSVTVKVIHDTNFDGLGELARRLRTLGDSVLVGVPRGAAEKDGTPTAMVAAANEFGTEDIPERSFLRSTINDAEKRRRMKLVNAHSLKAVARGEQTGDQALNRLGVVVAGMVKEQIVSGDYAPNAPSTIEKKESSKPLIDTGHLRQSITHVIDKGQDGPGVVR